ncbi:Hydroperoxy fatty acid reductase gpx1 [Aureliella helgolandensis]|uniref:Glutathione peroxidase n=1 Tax=Aureliella helgolandensis TaxID=2527968 RepID=A0A518GAK9_9BACT|nr:glutathione peroxidase [Aureliella helgolandensis]QDV25624.1 Hydroperoxy fatty acid reductase gpx1 [Aureliella helgolandensis]
MNTFAAEKESTKPPKALDFSVKNLGGEEVELKKYEGKVVLIVNVASECGLTDSNYKALQQVYEKYQDKGLVVLGFPCNQFGTQEPGSSKQISEFCTKEYGVTFDMFEKVEVNGDGANDLYKYLTALETKPKGSGKVSWNFEKFLVGRDGKVAGRFKPQTAPNSEEMIREIERLLAAKS